MSDATSFWKFIQEHSIEIPIIQRDYAQGRLGKEYLRESFLKNLKQAIEDNNRLTLDFIYGSTCNGKLHPLDGQQRLTTLWLFHWYIALKAGEQPNASERLRKFTYETRISSREFFEKLCSPDNFTDYNGSNVVDFITSRTWFYSSWKQDPTIQSILRMLGGTKINDKNNHDIIDGIEELFENESKEQFEKYWKCLTSDESPIVFYELPLENFGLSDDLYIKMNARGKQLTSFENFKADLVGYMYTKVREDEEDWKELVDTEKGIPIKLDTTWTDLFWPYRSAEYHIDEIYMSFLNRFFLNWYIATSPETAEKVEANDFYKRLSEYESKEGTEYHYQSFSIYEPVLTRDCIESLRTCLNRLNELYQTAKEKYGKEKQAVETLFNPYWEENADNNEAQFCFIPKYKTGENDPAKINLKQQVVFHAICVYLTTCSEINTDRLKDWMHFVWNIAENSNIDSSEQRISAIRFFEKGLAVLPKIENCETPDHASRDIIAYLAGIDGSRITNVFGRRQLLEEIAKAKRMKGDDNWKEKIHAAEKYAFFKGAVSFLLNNENGETEWNDFDRKLETAKQLFDKGGVKDGCKIRALHTLYSYCNDYWDQFWWNPQIFDCSAKTWKENILTKVGNDNSYVYTDSVHHLLMGDEPSKETKTDRQLQLLSNESFVKFLVEENSNNGSMYIRHPHDALYYRGYKYGVMLNFKERDDLLNLLLDEGIIELTDKNKRIEGTGLIWGNLNINFIYHIQNDRALHLQWFRQRTDREYDIYLMREDWSYWERPETVENERGDRKKYYCFNIDLSSIESFHRQVEQEVEQMKRDLICNSQDLF